MKIADRIRITKAAIKEANVKSSSDFVVLTHNLYDLFYPGYAKLIEPILSIETLNDKNDWWVENSIASEEFIALAEDANTVYDIKTAYRVVLDFLLEDESCSTIFNMDEEDHLGWKIFKELDTKYVYAKNLHEKMCFNKQVAIYGK